MIDADKDYIHVGYVSQCGDSNLQYTLLDCDTYKSKKRFISIKRKKISRRQTQKYSCVKVCLPPTLAQSYK